MDKHWYKIFIDSCPVCGSGDTTRERMLGEKPADWNETHKYSEVFDNCIY